MTGGDTYYVLGTHKKMSRRLCSVSAHLQGLLAPILVRETLQLLETTNAFVCSGKDLRLCENTEIS